ncbi:MAG TPA: rRNA adenine dimethyltransferase family protein, partial [Planctomycetota bacterium]|nr:rRNA adenine dimethyltransferase family protein [Planctomycetota bacterium]
DARVLAIEIDRGLADLLRETFAAELSSGRLTLLEGDALSGKHRLNPELASQIREIKSRENRPRVVLCSNLPYNAGTPIIAIAATDADDTGISEALVTVQLELAERMLAQTGSEEYGALSALIALRATGRIERVIGAEVFWPRPRVDSALLRLEFLPWPLPVPHPTLSHKGRGEPLQKDEVAGFQAFLQQVFSQRRKTLRAALKPRVLPDELAAWGERRAETVAPIELLSIYRGLVAADG